MKAIVVTDQAAGIAGMKLVKRPDPQPSLNGTGRANGRKAALDFGAQQYVDLESEKLQDVGGVDLVFDVFGGDIAKQSARLIRAGGTLVTVAGPTEARPANGSTIDFVVEPNPIQLSEIVQRVCEGRLRTNIGKISTFDDAVTSFKSLNRINGKLIIQVRP